MSVGRPKDSLENTLVSNVAKKAYETTKKDMEIRGTFSESREAIIYDYALTTEKIYQLQKRLNKFGPVKEDLDLLIKFINLNKKNQSQIDNLKPINPPDKGKVNDLPTL